MGYVAVTGGKQAIEHSQKLIEAFRTKESTEVLDVKLIEKQMRHLIDRIMGEGGLYAPEYAALALKQAEGDPFEAAFLLRAYRSTLPRNYYSHVIDVRHMRMIRRISSSFKDIPGGQLLGPTVDYTHRLLNFQLKNENREDLETFLKEFELSTAELDSVPTFEKVTDLLREEGLIANDSTSDVEEEPFDITREKLTFPLPASAKLQILSRGETGAMTAIAYSAMRGYGGVHPTIGELRVGHAEVTIPYPFAKDGEESIYIGEVMMTEVETINSFSKGKEDDQDVQFSVGYGLTFGQNEVKAIAMAILERSLETQGLGPAQDEEYVLLHIDSIESYGFVSHLKLPHYITFQSKLDRIRQAREKRESQKEEPENGKDSGKPIQHTRI